MEEECVPGDIVSLAFVPYGTGMRVEYRRSVDYTLLKASQRHRSGELEEDAKKCDQDEEAVCEDGVIARAHSCRRRVGP